MKPEEPNKWRKLGETVRADSLAFAIPMVLVSFPISGALIGRYLGQWLGYPVLTVVGLLVGLGMAVREVIRLIAKLNKAGK